MHDVDVRTHPSTPAGEPSRLQPRKGLDLADALHLVSRGSATGFASFDRKLTRRAAREGIDFVRAA